MYIVLIEEIINTGWFFFAKFLSHFEKQAIIAKILGPHQGVLGASRKLSDGWAFTLLY